MPVCLRKFYEIIAGERRWRAARMAGIKEIPVVIREYTDREIMEISLIENIQREDLNPIEEAMAYESLINEYSLTQEEVAEKVSKNRSTIANSLRRLSQKRYPETQTRRAESFWELLIRSLCIIQ